MAIIIPLLARQSKPAAKRGQCLSCALAIEPGRRDKAADGSAGHVPVPEYAQDKAGAKRDIVITLSEGTVTKCERPRMVLFLSDMTDPEHPVPISTYQADAKAGNYCDRFTYFGPHNIQPQTSSTYRGKLLFVTYFAGGLRVVDIRDPFRPVEVGHYLPAATANTKYVETKGPLVGKEVEKTPLTNDVAVDSRGYIYISDRANTGVHILRLTGKPAEIAGGLK